MSEELLGKILTELKRLNTSNVKIELAIRGFIAKAEALQPDLEYKTIHEDKKTRTAQKEKITHKIEDISIVHETVKAIRVQKEDKLAWIPKKAIEDKNVDEGNFGTLLIADWYITKYGIKWEEDDYKPIKQPPTTLP